LGEVCFYSLNGTDLIVDINGILNGSNPFPNRRTDTREGQHLAAGSVLRVAVPQAVGGKMLYGNLTSDLSGEQGFVTAFACDTTMPVKSDLNPMPGRVTANRLFVQANNDGEVCLYTLKDTDLIVDFNGFLSNVVTFPHFRFDTREPFVPVPGDGVELAAVSGSNWVAPEDITLSCVYAYDPGANIWNRYTYVDIDNQQPSVSGSRIYGGSVVMTIANPEFPVGNIQHTQTITSQLADINGHIGGYSTTYVVGVPTKEQASHLPTVYVEMDLWERVPPGSNRVNVGESRLEFAIEDCFQV
jgi:hypothetical protein